METWLTLQIPKIFEKNKIILETKEASEIYSKVAQHVAKLMDNILAMISTQSVIKDPDAHAILPRHVQSTLEYVQQKCYPTKENIKNGGNKDKLVMISYTILETTEDKDLFPSNEIISQLMEIGLDISNHTLNIVKRVLNMHVNCLMMDFHESQPLTLKKAIKVLDLKRHAIFH